MHLRLIIVTGFCFFSHLLCAQTGSVKGRVTDLKTNAPLPFVTVFLVNTSFNGITDNDGYYIINSVPPGTYNVSCSFIGYQPMTIYEVEVTSVKATVADLVLEESGKTIQEVEIVASPFNKSEESPVSIRTIGSAEIYRSPGGNRDISKVIQVLPGVGSSVSFRNDLIVRGGAPNENRFFLDGIEVPNINHFATQGSSGGPVGLINVNFLREVDFYAGAFPANRGNALSSVIDLKQKNGNEEKITGTVMFGSSDAGITMDGPTGKNSNVIFSVRRSYLQLLFKALALPFLPTYNDFQLKHTIKFKNNSSLTIIGLGAIDEFELNQSVNSGLTDSAEIESNNYILGYLPVNTQWNYTAGAIYKLLSKNGSAAFVASRNHLNNKSYKFRNNTSREEDKILDYNSAEIENKFRIENTSYYTTLKLNYGVEFENVSYTNETFRKIEVNGFAVTNDFQSELIFNKYALYIQAGKKLMNEKLILSAGIRSDFSDYSDLMLKPQEQLSPRISISLALTDKLFWNSNAGRYFQLPAYTLLGYRDSTNELINKKNNLNYIQCNHFITGLEFITSRFSKITVEGFYKVYNNYPFLLKDSISLANLGSDFGVIGNEAAVSTSEGRSYGLEFLFQQKLNETVYGLISYTLFKSEFRDKNNIYKPSSWDNGHIFNLIGGKKLKRNYEISVKFRLSGGAPYTPYDIALSSVKEVWDITSQGIKDWDRLNEERYPFSHATDIRIDKKWFFKKLAVDVYIDIQNIYNFQSDGQPYLTVQKDAAGNLLEEPADPSRYQVKLIENKNGTILPSIGIMIEF